MKVVEDALDTLPREFRSRIRNVAILVEDSPAQQLPIQPGEPGKLLLGISTACPQPARAFSICRQGRITSCFIKKH
jgi:hypothetical protein